MRHHQEVSDIVHENIFPIHVGVFFHPEIRFKMDSTYSQRTDLVSSSKVRFKND